MKTMTTKEFREYKEHTFDAFCKTVIKNDGISLMRSDTKQRSRQISLSDLAPADHVALSSIDTYSVEVFEETKPTTFWVNKEQLQIFDHALADALRTIPPHLRTVILLSYFFLLTDAEIAATLDIPQSTVNYRRLTALKRLRSLLSNGGEKTHG